MRKDIAPDFVYMFCGNGWKWNEYDGWIDADYDKFTATFLYNYNVKIQANVATLRTGIQVDGHLGVLWLEAVDYPDMAYDENNGFSIEDLEDVIGGLITAEENLIRCGIPFTKDYKFHGRNKANMKRRNDALRKKLNMERWEKEIMESRNRRNENE